MAQKVFVSPGVYTTESELSFVAQSVGVTTLGIAGETLKGPAFEPIFITNFDEFQSYFGPTSPEKFVNTQIPKYELAYIAKSYLQQSNQLFVTRVLGLSGYDAGPSWSIQTVANVDGSTVGINNNASKYSVYFDFSGNTNGSGIVNVDYTNLSNTPLLNVINNQYTDFDGSVSTLNEDLKSFVLGIMNSPNSSGNTSSVYGPMSGIPTSFTSLSNVFNVQSVQTSAITYNSRLNDAWYYSNFEQTSPGNNSDNYSGFSFYQSVTALTSSAANTFSGRSAVTMLNFSGTAFSGYNNLVITTLRSRGITDYNSSSDGPTFQVDNINNCVINVSGSYSAATRNPFGVFNINGTNINSIPFSFDVSLDDTSANFISKVLGTGNFQKDRNDVPIFVEERFPTMLNYGFNQGYIRGIKNVLVSTDRANSLQPTSIGNYLERYQTAYSPWVVSELRGNTVFQLFRFITISDGSASNRVVKISLANMSFDNDTFDVLIRDYYDTDANPVVVEKYTNCTMDPSQNNYVGVKIGTADGQYQINSKYVMLELNEEAPIDALPCGFEGYLVRNYDTLTPMDKVEYFPIYKTRYYNPGDQVSNPPFGNSNGSDDAVLSNGENVRRAYLGFSSSIGWDESFFEYKGKQTPTGFTCTEQTYNNWSKLTKGFHMDSGASVVSISSIYSTSGLPAFDCGLTSFRSEPESPNDPYYRTYSRKFTLLCGGGFDGWDVYREYRTNSDSYQLGKSGYLYGSLEGCPSYPNATGWGAFRQITVEDDTTNWGNTDYYAYKLGIASFSNPGIININVFATPGIDYINNFQLIKASIDMVEIDRADSIYITTTPDFDMLQPSVSMDNFIYPQDAVDNLAYEDIDSNYTATYYPWVLTKDSVNNTQIYIPPTAEVCRNLALTDNISFPWFATAGYTRGIVNAVRARRRLTQLDRDTLYQGRINPIATFNDVGTVIWGNKTLQIRESPLDRLNVRRLLLQARKLISAVAIRLLFEQNDAVVRQQFLDSVNPILDAIRRDRGIYDFRVTVDSSPAALDSNQMSGKIFIKPTKALEFIDIEFVVTPQGASFENI